MKLKRFFFTVLVFVCMCTSSFSQTVNGIILDKYPPSIVSKTFEVLARVEIDDQRQIKLADIFWREDSAIAIAIKNGKGISEINQAHRVANSDFHSLLDEKELNLYYFNLLKDQTYKQAVASATLQCTLLNGDSTLKINLTKMYFNHYLQIERVKRQFWYSNLLYKHINKVTTFCDSIAVTVVRNYAEGKFYSDKFYQLNRIKPLNANDRGNLSNGFYNLCRIRPAASREDIFNEVMHTVVLDTIYYAKLYEKEIRKMALINSNRSAIAVSKMYKLPKRCYDTLVTVLYEKEKKLATVYYSFPTITAQRQNLEGSINAHYDSITDHILYHEGVKVPGSHFFIAIRHRDNLNLTNAQVDTLLNRGFKFERLVKVKKAQNDVVFDRKAYERERLREVLTVDQLYNLVRIISREPATRYTLKNWKEMKSYGLVTSSDSLAVIEQLFKYQLSSATVIDYFSDDERSKRDRLKSIEMSKPLAVKQLHAARKMEAANAKKAKSESDQPNNSEDGPANSTPKKTYKGTFQY